MVEKQRLRKEKIKNQKEERKKKLERIKDSGWPDLQANFLESLRNEYFRKSRGNEHVQCLLSLLKLYFGETLYSNIQISNICETILSDTNISKILENGKIDTKNYDYQSILNSFIFILGE